MRREPRPTRINRIARKFAVRAERQRFKAPEKFGGFKKPLAWKETKSRLKPIIAYDLETTRIREGSPTPLYITAYGEQAGADLFVSIKLSGMVHLCEVLEQRFLQPELKGVRFVAWNGNNFDVYLVGAALLHSDKYVIRPYLTRSKALRGLRVTLKSDKKIGWEFLDGISMTLGQAGLSEKERSKFADSTLKKFLNVFAPEYGKLEGPNFEKEEFDGDNPDHVRYAERDSIGLYHAMMKAQAIVYEAFGVPLFPTVGNTAIRIFQRNMPKEIQVWEPPYSVLGIIRDQVMRGGYCWLAKKYTGPIWKYDLNQAYAAAMRDALLPAGRCIHGGETLNKFAKVFIVKVRAQKPGNRVPFYYRDMAGDAVFGLGDIGETWITSIEYEQLKREKWNVTVLDSYFWDDTFTMKNYVARLEKLRRESPGGPNGAQGLMVKAIGNNSYGKTVETLDGIELLLSVDQPEGFFEYQAESDELRHIWFKLNRPVPREYHQPQIGSFITAHVRMVVRRAALIAQDAWLYADTDCVVFSQPVALDIDPVRYGAWKVEVSDEPYRLIQKKVYAKVGGGDSHAKGLNVKRLSEEDFENWANGRAPIQSQLQRNNFIKVMTGAQMFVTRVKTGEIFGRKAA